MPRITLRTRVNPRRTTVGCRAQIYNQCLQKTGAAQKCPLQHGGDLCADFWGIFRRGRIGGRAAQAQKHPPEVEENLRWVKSREKAGIEV